MTLPAHSEDVFSLHDSYSATTLFNIWTKYAPRLPSDYYNEKLLKVGDSLCQIKVSGYKTDREPARNKLLWLLSIWVDSLPSLKGLIFFFNIGNNMQISKTVLRYSNSHNNYKACPFILYLKVSRWFLQGPKGAWDGRAAQLSRGCGGPTAGSAESPCSYLTQRSPDTISCCFSLGLWPCPVSPSGQRPGCSVSCFNDF